MMLLLLLCASSVLAAEDGVLSYYNFDSGRGDNLTDLVGGHHGVIEGAAWQRTAAGHGLQFDGRDDHVSLGSDPAFSFTGSFSVELWVRHTDVDGWQDYVGNYTGGKRGFVIAQNDGYLYFHQGGLEPYIVETEVVLQPGVWYHICAVYDRQGGAMRVYVDGAQLAAETVKGIPEPSTDVPLYLGRYRDGRERFKGIMEELRIWRRALSEAQVMARYGEHAGAFKPDTVDIAPVPLPKDVLMGMALEGLQVTGDEFAAVTTGARFTLTKGVICCRQRIPSERETARIVLPQSAGPFALGERTDFACRMDSDSLELRIHGDSLLILKTKRPQALTFQGLFEPEYHAQHRGKHLFIDELGGLGVYPVRAAAPSTPDFKALPWALTRELRAGDEVWVSIFPPRPCNHARGFESLAHEGLADRALWYPSDELIEATARYCKVLAIHSYIFPGGEKPPWRIPRFYPVDIDKWHEVRRKVQERGMKVIPYFSPFYYKGSLALVEGGPQRTYFDEVRDAIEVLKADGVYFDGVSMDFRKSYAITRKTRQMLGDDRILYVHCSTDPLGSPGIYCPFIDSYADYILRGEAGRGTLDRDRFLRWVVSSYNIGNAVGIWCYYGSTGASGYRNVVPTPEDIDAALRLHARLWRQGMSWQRADAGRLQDFDREYYSKLERLRVAHERAAD